jgi:hypothetical protein
MTARMVRCRGTAARRRGPGSRELSSRRAARPSIPSTSTRGAVNSIANGKPSSLRQIATTGEALASVSAKSSIIAVTRSTKSCTAGKGDASLTVRPGDGSGLLSGPRRRARSPGILSGWAGRGWESRGRGSRGGGLFACRSNEIVAAPHNRGDVTIVALAVAERTPQSADLDLQICVVHERCWPDPGDQLLLTDHPAGLLTTLPVHSTRAVRMSKARPPSRTGLSPSSRRRRAATRRDGPNEIAASSMAPSLGSHSFYQFYPTRPETRRAAPEALFVAAKRADRHDRV